MDLDERKVDTEETDAGRATDDHEPGAVADADQQLGDAVEAALAATGTDDPLEGAGQVLTFDFNRAHSISKNFEQQLKNICESFAKAGTINLTNLFRVNTVLEFEQLTLRACGDFLDELPNPTFLATVGLAPLKGRSVVHVDLGLCFSMLKKLMGGAAEAEESVREFTEIERSLFRRILVKLLDCFTDATARVVKVSHEIDTLENNPDYISGLATADTLVFLMFQLKIDSLEGNLAIGLPMSGFEPVQALFDPEEKRELRSAQELHQDRGRILDLVQGTDCELVVKLGELGMTFEELMQLKEGDLLDLNQPVEGALVLEVEGKPVFLGEAGRVHNNRAVKLAGRICEE